LAAAVVTAVCAVLATPPASAAPTLPAPTAAASSTGSRAHIAVPPIAPPPTDGGVSPASPDPHPPLGGIAPDGSVPGGARLRSRGVIVPPHAPALPAGLTAQAWALVDLDSGAILAARDPHGRYQPASILKTLTSVTLIPQLPGDRKVVIDAATANTEGSHAGLIAGGTYTVDQLFAGLLLVSGNDAAVALAKAAVGVPQTVAAMNRTALRLGAYDTFVQTPSGLDGWQQLTSAYDMAIFLRAALAMPRFVRYERLPSATLPAQSVTGTGPITLANQNEKFLTTVPGALVAKTGYTDAAQHTFVGAIERHGRRLGVVFMRAQRYPTDQWQQATALMDWGFALPTGTAPVGELAAPVITAGPTAGVANAQLIDPAQRARQAAEIASAVAAVTTFRRSDGNGGNVTRLLLLTLGGLLVLAGFTLHWHARRLH
jgi:D-alanyl-D-alanine carboxypeptidase (penicillin-binding protein 5/6)